MTSDLKLVNARHVSWTSSLERHVGLNCEERETRIDVSGKNIGCRHIRRRKLSRFIAVSISDLGIS